MAKSLGSFRAALLIGWGLLGLAGIGYARFRGIPNWAALPVVAAFLIEYPFYLAPAFPAVRERLNARAVPLFALAVAILPYLACCCGAAPFAWTGLARLTGVALAVSLWFVVLPPSRVTDFAFLGLFGAVLLGHYFDPVYTSAAPTFKDLKNIILIPHISLIAMTVMALMRQRGIGETGYGFLPNSREWRIGLVNAALFVPIGLTLALLLHATRFTRPKPAWYVLATFIGMLWVLSLSEEFLFRGVMQPWLEEWTANRSVALDLTSAIFGLVHLPLGGFPNWRWALVAGILGWFCGRARNQAGSIRASMVTHALIATAWRSFFA